jgi:hypothetical protein
MTIFCISVDPKTPYGGGEFGLSALEMAIEPNRQQEGGNPQTIDKATLS